jgi:hypothetical protein
MATITAPTITAYQAQAEAGGFLNDHMPDRFCAGRPHLDYDAYVWRVPILLSYPVIGPVGQVGEILVSAGNEQVISFTPIEEMKSLALHLYEEHRDAIEAAFLRARNA